MSKLLAEIEEFESVTSSFVSYFELVFHNDWEMTKTSCDDELLIKNDGSFIEPKVEDEENNWANRARLLESYRALVSYMEKNGINWDKNK